MTRRFFHVLSAASLWCTTVFAQGEAPQLQVGAIADNDAIHMDGIPDEAAWQQAAVIENLTQQSPHPGEPTPYHTRILVLHGQHMLFIGVVAEDPDPQQLSTHTMVRDGDQGNDDNLTFVLDTFGTRRVAYVFQVNAAGAMADGLLAPTPAINSNNGVDYNWDGIWDAKVTRNDHGWTAEIAIDTRSLQFGDKVTAWGFNVSRNVPRALLTLNWSGTTLDSSVFNLQREGLLAGVQDVRQGAGLDFQPYGIFKQETGSGDTSKAGFDLKYNFTPSTAGLFTYHTDFAEAEADQQQINTGRFPLFFPEKRQFFLQGSNLFSFGYNLGTNFIPFNSRTIGLVNGEVTPLNEGVKIIGQGDSGSLALLDTQMGTVPGVADSTNLFVGRGNYNVTPELQMGALVTHGDPLGVDSNTFVGTDATWKTSTFQGDKNLNLSAWAGRSTGDLPSGNPDGFGAGIEYPNDLWYAQAQFSQFGDALEPALGFVPRPGTRHYFTELSYQPRPARDSVFNWVHRFWFYGHYSEDDGFGPLDGGKQSSEWWFSPQMLTEGGWYWEFDVYQDFDAPAQPFDLVANVTVPAGQYTWNRRRVVFNSPTFKPLWFQFIDSQGTYYAGTGHHPLVEVNWNLPDGQMQLSASQEWFFYYSPQGDGATRLSTLTGTWSFTPTLYFSTQMQYQNDIPGVSYNARIRWIVGGASNVYLVLNHGTVTETNGLGQPVVASGNVVIFKVQWDFRN